MKKLLLVVGVLLVVAGIIRYALHTQPVESEQLVITGSSTLAPLIQDIAERFQSVHPGSQISVQASDSQKGLADVRQGLADIGMVSRDPAPQEQDLKWYTVARDGVGVIVNRDNPVDALTDGRLADIFTGKVTDWSDVGGGAAPITVINAAEGNASRDIFIDHFGINADDLKEARITGYAEQMVKEVAADPNAIGYVSLATAERMVGQGAAVRLLPLDSVTAVTENVRNGTYPLARTLNLVTRSEPLGLAKRFITYTRSAQTAGLIEARRFAPVK